MPVERYVDQVESVRLAVNDLLEGADPILDDYRSYRVTPDQAAPRMGDLGSQFAAQLVTVESITAGHPVLVADLPHGDFADLPNTQNDQRQAIIEWWTQLEVLARQTGAGLPDDLHRAGRGEIAPSPTES